MLGIVFTQLPEHLANLPDIRHGRRERAPDRQCVQRPRPFR